MTWTLAWYLYQQKEWKRRALWAEGKKLVGHRCYAERQIWMWAKMHDAAEHAWNHALQPHEF